MSNITVGALHRMMYYCPASPSSNSSLFRSARRSEIRRIKWRDRPPELPATRTLPNTQASNKFDIPATVASSLPLLASQDVQAKFCTPTAGINSSAPAITCWHRINKADESGDLLTRLLPRYHGRQPEVGPSRRKLPLRDTADSDQRLGLWNIMKCDQDTPLPTSALSRNRWIAF